MENYFNKIIELFVNSNASASSRDEFHRWLAGEKFHEEKEEALRTLWDKMDDQLPTTESTHTQQSLDEVHRKIYKRQQPKRNQQRLRFWQVSAACLLAALLSTPFWMPRKSIATPDLIEQHVPIAKITRLILPDGTQVQMNSTSTLLYPTHFTGESRSVYLIGEANFKVAKNENQPFVVKSDNFQVTALGTEFNMKVYPDDPILSTTLLSGSVEVRYNDLASSRILNPNEQFTYHRKTKEETISHPDINDVTAWQRGDLVFKSATLEEIIAVLERKYPYSFVYTTNTLRADRYTFRFTETTPLEEIMNIIVEVSGNLKYRIEDNQYYLSPQ